MGWLCGLDQIVAWHDRWVIFVQLAVSLSLVTYKSHNADDIII